VLNRLKYYKTWGEFRNTLTMPRSYVNNLGGRSYKNYNPNDIKNVVDAVRYKQNDNTTNKNRKLFETGKKCFIYL